jgi:methyltransferase (TIGR00027 family)
LVFSGAKTQRNSPAASELILAQHMSPREGVPAMNEASSLVQNICDTARWVAYFRARETERPDALFRDPYAARLAGERGFHIANTLPDGNKHEWAWVARTYLFDQFLSREIQEGADLVLNLAAGLDARPYRMDLPATLQWVEVDLPEILAYKQEVISNEKPNCCLERIVLDLSDLDPRRRLFADMDRRATKIVVITEGLLIYFSPEEVACLARDLAAGAHFGAWIIDLASPGQLRLMQRTTGKQLGEIGAAFKFGPSEGANFFVPYGWAPKDVRGLLKTAAEFGRPPAELLALLPEPKGAPGNRPWSGVCLLTKR